jgi:hypothetical protein
MGIKKLQKMIVKIANLIAISMNMLQVELWTNQIKMGLKMEKLLKDSYWSK